MLDIFLNFENQQAAVQIAALGIFGGIIVALINLFTKYIELIFNRKKEITTEKLRDFSRIQNIIHLMLSDYTATNYNDILNSIKKYIDLNSDKLLKINVLVAQDKLSESNIIVFEFYNGLSSLIDNDLKMNTRIFRETMNTIIGLSPWILTRTRLIHHLGVFSIKADENRVLIQNEMANRVKASKDMIGSITTNLDYDTVTLKLTEAMDILLSDINLKLHELNPSMIHKTMHEEIYATSWHIKLNNYFHKFRNRK